MRIIILLLLSFFSSTILVADCGNSAFFVFPATKTLQSNSMIVLTGYASSQGNIRLLEKEHTAYLVSGKHRVKLDLKSLNEGMYYLTQAILQPENSLIPGKTYELKIKNQAGKEIPMNVDWDNVSDTYKAKQWTIVEGTDTEAPIFTAQPSLSNSKVMMYGCGPGKEANFSVPTQDASLLLVETELVDLEKNASNIYFLPYSGKGLLLVGHGMCSGEFDFTSNGKYKIRFRLMDICGNQSDEWSNWILFDNPR